MESRAASAIASMSAATTAPRRRVSCRRSVPPRIAGVVLPTATPPVLPAGSYPDAPCTYVRDDSFPLSGTTASPGRRT
ncbi:hypothetical protein GCM10010206_08550 [Streptomyces cinerochromogenes]|nr:hypothetical protein GCM10010206_08550 [Streptomyces cinerochromogenes]